MDLVSCAIDLSLFQVNWKVVLSNLRIYPIVCIQNTISLNQSNLLLSANEVVGKVMFLHVSVICSEGESPCTEVCLHRGSASEGVVLQGGGSANRGSCAEPPPRTRKAGSTHLTGMLSCWLQVGNG